ncbi:hypothetical protein EAF04_001863 [Stromatinia cepivora]|nr:hypothetical protein EAF04_001863 [Stromatinia cepivora]
MGNPNDHSGRIDKQAFLISTGVLLAVGLVSAICRFYVRFRIQKDFGLDDGFLLIGICCIVIALIMQYSINMEPMYLAEALTHNPETAVMPPDFLQQVFEFQKWITVILMLTWTSIMAVKFSFLFLFRKLIDRIRPLKIYWWIVTIITTGILGFGISVYYLACPYYFSLKALQCLSETGSNRTKIYASTEMALDILSDVMILTIPICLIWQVKIKWTQKIMLAMSLCLTIILTIVAIIRVYGLQFHGKVDQIWEIYWLIIGAEVGVILTSATAFRTFFVARSNNKLVQSPHGGLRWYYKSRQTLKRLMNLASWRSKSNVREGGYEQYGEEGRVKMNDLPSIPRAHMTGVRTFIDGKGKSQDVSQLLRSEVIHVDSEVSWDEASKKVSGETPAKGADIV